MNLTCVSGMLRVDVERRLSRYVQIIPSISSSVNLGDVVESSQTLLLQADFVCFLSTC